jgi:hypothetical protein
MVCVVKEELPCDTREHAGSKSPRKYSEEQETVLAASETADAEKERLDYCGASFAINTSINQ